MKGSIFLVMFASAMLIACGKIEEAAAPAPAVEAPLPAEPVAAEPAAIEPAPAEAVEAAEPAVIPAETPVATPPATAKPAQPAPASPAAAAKAPVAAPTSAPAPSAPKPDLAHGQQIYRQACAFCHDKGVAGAPKLGDAAAWSARLAQGMDAMYATAIRGKGAMPAKGGNPALADADVKAAVDFIAAQSR